MRSLRTHRSRAVAALCVGALAISACSGSDDDSSSPDPAAVATTVATEPPTDTPAPDSAAPVTGTPTTDTDTAVADTVADTVDTPVDEGAPDVPEILQVSAPLVGGGAIDLADYADRPLLLWFWAPF